MFDPTATERELEAWVSGLEPGQYSGRDARTLLDRVGRIKRLAGAAETLLALRVADTGAWQDEHADRSAAHWLARRTGTTVGEARAKLETAGKLAGLPATAEALRAGKLSDQQTREVVAGAIADPSSEAKLLVTATEDSLRELRHESRRAQAVDDEEGRQARIHARRGLWAGVETDGEFRLTLRTTALDGAEILAALAPYTDQVFKQAQKERRRESLAAYRADGLLALAKAKAPAGAEPGGPEHGPPRSNVKMIVAVDLAALRRGHVGSGETCEIKGVGPISVPVARDLLGDAALAIVVKEGVDVCNVTHLKRQTTAHQRTVLEWWGLRCRIKGCDSTDFVDIHHVLEWAKTHRTRLDELEVDCRYHHRRRHRGWQPTSDQLRARPVGSQPGGQPVDADLQLPLIA